MSPIDDDYIEVAERQAEFFKRFPEGCLRPNKLWEVREVGGQWFVVFEAAAYRSAEDSLPGIGTAWEPFPGPTAFTRNSELQNAETSAWGRAMTAVGILASRKLATVDDIRNRTGQDPRDQDPSLERAKARQGGEQPPTLSQQVAQSAPDPGQAAAAPAAGKARKGASDAQRRRIFALIQAKAITRQELDEVLMSQFSFKTDPAVRGAWLEKLTPGRDGTASKLIDELQKFEVIPEKESDIPADQQAFTPETAA